MDMLWVSYGKRCYGKGKLKGIAPRGDGKGVYKRGAVHVGGGANR